jgi:hypothetical protein
VSTDQNDQIKSKLFSRFITFVLIALCCLFMLPACDTDPGYSSGKELSGVIVNADTGEPIPDSIVVAKWITSAGTAVAVNWYVSTWGPQPPMRPVNITCRPGGKKAPSVPSTSETFPCPNTHQAFAAHCRSGNGSIPSSGSLFGEAYMANGLKGSYSTCS